jgi:hypothetical protein
MKENPTPDNVELTADECATLAEYQAALRDVQQQIQGVYRLISRQHGLAGVWDLSEDGKSLIRRANG